MHMTLVERRLNTPAAPARAVITAGAALSTSYERAAGLFLDGKPCSELHLLLCCCCAVAAMMVRAFGRAARAKVWRSRAARMRSFF